jgi:hypothetical protein
VGRLGVPAEHPSRAERAVERKLGLLARPIRPVSAQAASVALDFGSALFTLHGVSLRLRGVGLLGMLDSLW